MNSDSKPSGERAASLCAAEIVERLERLTRSGSPTEGPNPAQWDALRYIARANRFSRTPGALAAFLGSTRGTVSQTLLSLEGKGLIVRAASQRDRRSIELALTAAGTATLAGDPLLALADDIARATDGDAGRLLGQLQGVLAAAIARNGGRPFGVCASCRHFCRAVWEASAEPHQCALLDAALSEDDSRAICSEQEPAAPP